MNNNQKIYMGNNSTCCKDSRANAQQYQRVDIVQTASFPISSHESPLVLEYISPSSINIQPLASLPHWLTAVLTQKKLFLKQLQNHKNASKHLVKEEVYFGQLDENKKPAGFGQIQKKDGTFYIGYFRDGQANGSGIYFLSQNSYYQGDMVNDRAQSAHGYFKDEQIEYQGGFQNNQFNGLGQQKGANYQFNGEYAKGKRKQGLLKWQQNNGDYSYKGKFDENGKFVGLGKLSEPMGVYQGEFLAGIKEGYGVYRFKTQIRYQGYYKGNEKNGRGQIINKDGTIAFAGQFLNGVPHGKGYATDVKGNKYSLQWNEGVYAHLL